MSVNPRVLAACLVGSGLITGAFFLAPETNSTQASAEGVVAVAPDRHAIAVADTDNDGIPDWQEEFGHIAPTPVTLPASSSDAYTPPDTLTGQLAISLLTNTVRAETYGSLGQSQEQIIAGAMQKVAASSVDELYTTRVLRLVRDTNPEKLRAYGNQVAEIILMQELPTNSRGELEILQHAIRADNPEILNELAPIITGYKNLHDLMLALEVPSSVANEHVNLLNSYHALLQDLEGMADAFSDPLYSLLRLKRYHDDAAAMVISLENLYNALQRQGADFQPTDPVFRIMDIK